MTPGKPNTTLRHYFTHGLFPQLRVFEACARLGSFSRAAEELCIAQPTVSCQIRKLNETVGTLLFDMSGKKVSLTPAGRELQNLCHDLFDQVVRFDRRLKALKQQSSLTVRIATTSSNQYLVARALCQLGPQEDYQIAVHIVNRRQLLELLHQGQHDIYFVEDLAGFPGFDVIEIPGQELSILARCDHPLAGRRDISLAELAQEYWLLREEGSGTGDAVSSRFSGETFAPRVRAVLGSNDAIRLAILDGMGIGVLPTAMFRDGPEAEGLIRLDVVGFALRYRCHALVPQKEGMTTAVAALISKLIHNIRLKPSAVNGDIA